MENERAKKAWISSVRPIVSWQLYYFRISGCKSYNLRDPNFFIIECATKIKPMSQMCVCVCGY